MVHISQPCCDGAVSRIPDVAVAWFVVPMGPAGPGHSAEDAITSAHPTGYQRQLTYKCRDGAYSAFGERDASGSMW